MAQPLPRVFPAAPGPEAPAGTGDAEAVASRAHQTSTRPLGPDPDKTVAAPPPPGTGATQAVSPVSSATTQGATIFPSPVSDTGRHGRRKSLGAGGPAARSSTQRGASRNSAVTRTIGKLITRASKKRRVRPSATAKTWSRTSTGTGNSGTKSSANTRPGATKRSARTSARRQGNTTMSSRDGTTPTTPNLSCVATTP
mmetsp:Transcript_37744/g.84391  ORF Transcript_37744/g.84391 Transcript_37744/m.84391 type:complete len:198 (+) Transcript_37744:378-971(+)